MAVNAEFQELWRRYSVEQDDARKTDYLEEMKNNLTTRNGGADMYVFLITDNGETVSISSSCYDDVIRINGNMNLNGI